MASCSKTALVREYSEKKIFSSYFFAKEKAIFLFYEFKLPQSLLKDGFLEIYWDKEWKKVVNIQNVYVHDAPICAKEHLCGSLSLYLEPILKKDFFNVQMRLRYHEDSDDGEYFTSFPVSLKQELSYLVYGFFSEDNLKVGWNYRHNFPGMSQEKVHDLGLRRYFKFLDFKKSAAGSSISLANPWMFDHDRCQKKEYQIKKITTDRSSFSNFSQQIYWEDKPYFLSAEDDSTCGIFQLDLPHAASTNMIHTAIARKNPEVSPALSKLFLHIKENGQIPFQIGRCSKIGSNASFLGFQRKRLGVPSIEFDVCLEDLPHLSATELAQSMIKKFDDAIIKDSSKDYLLMILIHRIPLNYEKDLSDTQKILTALSMIGYQHGMKLSPRISGVFVYDTFSLLGGIPDPMKSYISWCPQTDPKEIIEGCTVFESSMFKKGIFTFSLLPVFPSFEGFENYKKEHGNKTPKEAFIKRILSHYRSDGVIVAQTNLNAFATFDTDNKIFVSSEESISYCPLEDPYQMLVYQVEDPSLALDDLEEKPNLLFSLSDAHSLRKKSAGYYLGIAWRQGFLMEYNYDASVDIKISVLPFSISKNSDLFFGDRMWQQKEMDFSRALGICKKYCGNPFFTSEGKYHVTESWANYHRKRCYHPQVPKYVSSL